MWPDRVFVKTPSFRQHLHLLERVEDFAVQELIAQPRVEALDHSLRAWGPKKRICESAAEAIHKAEVIAACKRKWAPEGTHRAATTLVRYQANSLRFAAPATPNRPVPNRTKLDGSGVTAGAGPLNVIVPPVYGVPLKFPFVEKS